MNFKLGIKEAIANTESREPAAKLGTILILVSAKLEAKFKY